MAYTDKQQITCKTTAILISVIGHKLSLVSLASFFYYPFHTSPLSASTSAALGSFAGGVTQTFIPAGSEPSVIFAFLVVIVFSLTFTTGHGITKKHPQTHTPTPCPPARIPESLLPSFCSRKPGPPW